jgi:PAS domain S-box-containing protein
MNLEPTTDLIQFLRTAIRVAGALAHLHKDGIVHQNIRPQNILVDKDTLEIKFVGIGEDPSVAAQTSDGQRQGTPATALPYMSPEQTGRMNRPVDHRTDLYSLGVTFYEMLANALPFQANDSIGWVHCHIARPPRPLTEVAPEIPQGIADIVMRLLSKVAEERYQSARGLEIDLKRCLAELEVNGTVEPFPLGGRDTWDKLQIPAKLYGRSEECAALLTVFDRVVQTGVPELMLVTGYSGIGKTSVVQEVHKPIVRERGFFASGKFEQYKRDIPYLTITQALRELTRQILTESELDLWRTRLLEALGPNAQLVIDVVPQLELIIGKQPPVPPLPPTEAQGRFNKVFQRFIGVFAKREHPLALFLDDLQWADHASLKLLHHLLTQSGQQYLFLMGAYRDNEVSPSHPLVAALDELRKEHVRLTTITLGPLSLEHLTELATDTFHCHIERAEPMAKLLRLKTDGNPFFVTQFLTELYKEQLVRFDPTESAWRWTIAEIQAKNFTDNIVDFMVGKLKRLPPETQAAMQLAACIGNQSDVSVLSTIYDKGIEETHQDLRPAVREGLILRRGITYKFLHDRVQQAAYTLIPEAQRNEVHLRVGRLLLKRTPPEAIDDRLFDIINQLNVGAALITDDDERRSVAALNLRAGKKAKASSAYGSAASYLSTGVSLLPQKAWDVDYDVAYGLHTELGECSCLVGNFETTDRMCTEVLAHAKTSVEKGVAYRARIQMHIAKAEPPKAVETGLTCLRLFGIDLPASPGKQRLLDELRSILDRIQTQSVEELIDLPRMTDPERVAAIDTLTVVYPSAFWTDMNLADLIACQMVRMSMDYGNTAASATGYAFFGKALVEHLAAYKEAFRFGKLGFDLTETHNLVAAQGNVANLLGCAIASWTRHINTQAEYNRIGFQAALEAGDIPNAGFNGVNLVTAQLVRGDPLDAVYKTSVAQIDFLTKAKLMFLVDFTLGTQRYVQNMRGLTDHFSTFNGDGFDQDEYEARVRTTNINIVNMVSNLAKLQARFMSENYAEALSAAEIVKENLYSLITMIYAAEYHFFAALATAAHYGDVDDEKQREYQAALTEHSEKLRGWSESCPENFLGKHLLVSAEIARVNGRDKEAGRLYDQAVKAFRDSGFVHNEGIANELAARFYIRSGYGVTIPRAYLQESRTCYARWGAHGKVSQLVRKYPEILEVSLDPDQAPPSKRANASAEQLDTMTAVKASQALSSEMGPERLMTTLMRIVIEHAGATRCCLLLPFGEAMSLAAEGVADHQGIDVRIPEPGTATAMTTIPTSLINYVRRTREKIILNDAANHASFSSDDYITRIRPKSVLCLPIVRNTAVVGVLYLENPLVRGAFVPRRLPLIEFLAAISLQNASLYNELAHENAERKQAEETLRKATERMRRLIEIGNVVPWEADGETGQFTYVGPQAQQILGYSAEEWYAENFLKSRVHPEDQARTLERFKRAAAGEGHDDFELRILAADGRSVRLHGVVSTTKREDGTSTLGGFLFKLNDHRASDGATAGT